MTAAEVDALLERLADCAAHARALIPPRADTIDEAAALIREQRAALAQAQQEIADLGNRGARLAGYLDAAEAELKQAQARIAALERDAARYRWLRDPPQGFHEVLSVCGQNQAFHGGALDVRVDAAMSAAGGKA